MQIKLCTNTAPDRDHTECHAQTWHVFAPFGKEVSSSERKYRHTFAHIKLGQGLPVHRSSLHDVDSEETVIATKISSKINQIGTKSNGHL